jgi:hypothetical protein
MKKVRVLFLKPDGEVAANIWVNQCQSGTKFCLLQEYPDFKPEVGWHIQCREDKYVINVVNGLEMEVTKV